MFENMEEELEWFDESPSFNDICVRLNAKFDGDFTLNGRFGTGKQRGRKGTGPRASIWLCRALIDAAS